MPVTKFEIKTRKPFAEGQVFGDAGPYEQLEGVAGEQAYWSGR